MFVLTQIVLLAGSGFEAETFQVRIVLLVGIIKRSRPYLVGIELLDDTHIIFVVIAEIEV